MAARPVWRGHLRLALVSCPIALHTVHRSAAGLHFHFLNPDTGNRVRTVTLDAETDRELARGDLARGYEYEKDRYVVVDEADFETARVDSSSLLVIDKFVPIASIDPIYYDASYYLAPDPDGKRDNADVYLVLRDAIARAGMAALSRVVLSRRERPVAIHAMGRGLVLHTLFDRREIASAEEAFAPIPHDRPDDDMVALAKQLIDRQRGRFDPADAEDRYETRLREVIEAKIGGEIPDPPPERARDDGKVVDLMAALRRSLGDGAKPAKPARPAARGAKAKPAAKKPKAAPAKKAAKPRGPAPRARKRA